MADTSQRTEKATPRRLQKARKEGDFPAVREFVSAVQFLAFVLLASAWFPDWLASFESAFRMGLRQSFSASLNPNDLIVILRRLAIAVLRPLASLGLVLMGITVLFQLASNNLGFSLARLAPKFARISPLRKLKDLPANNFAQFAQAVVMIPVMFWLTWTMVRGQLPDLLRLPLLPIAGSVTTGGILLRDVMRKASLALVLLGAVMLARGRGRYRNQLKMSKQDLRDESKETEGNPQIKARIRRIQRDMRRKNMMREVATATAVIVNPTHYAVALRYEQGTMAAPCVVA
jgi:flagellar biosynthetic protein FlhB